MQSDFHRDKLMERLASAVKKRFAHGADAEQRQGHCLRGPHMISKPNSRLRLPLTIE